MGNRFEQFRSDDVLGKYIEQLGLKDLTEEQQALFEQAVDARTDSLASQRAKKLGNTLFWEKGKGNAVVHTFRNILWSRTPIKLEYHFGMGQPHPAQESHNPSLGDNDS